MWASSFLNDDEESYVNARIPECRKKAPVVNCLSPVSGSVRYRWSRIFPTLPSYANKLYILLSFVSVPFSIVIRIRIFFNLLWETLVLIGQVRETIVLIGQVRETIVLIGQVRETIVLIGPGDG
jgi:hypothetical protein